jgi:hypothetical protein
MMLGSQSVTAFGLMFAYLLPTAGPILTALASWVFGVGCFSVPNALTLRWLSARQVAKAEAESQETIPAPDLDSTPPKTSLPSLPPQLDVELEEDLVPLDIEEVPYVPKS